MPNAVQTSSIGQPGLWITHARHNFLVAGASAEKGGTGEAWLAAELLLSALTSCATSIVSSAAAQRGIALTHTQIRASSERDTADPGRYASVTLDFLLSGPSLEQAHELVAQFQRECPIYGTISRGAPLTTTVSVSGFA